MEYMAGLPDKAFDLAIVDPPYGINAANMSMGQNLSRDDGWKRDRSTAQILKKGRLNQGAGHFKGRSLTTMNCDWDFKKPDPEYWTELFRVSRNRIIWGGNYFPLPPTRGIVVWDKVQPWDNFSQVELAWTSFDTPAKLIRLSNRGGRNDDDKIHPTQKPCRLYQKLISLFANNGDKILDTHLGSGSSAIAAEKSGYDFVGCEIDKNYFDSAVKRFNKSVSQPLFD